MAITCMSKQYGGYSGLSRLLLLLFLAGLQPVLSSDGGQSELHGYNEEGPRVSIVCSDYVTVDVPSSVECVANCSACNYSMSLDGRWAPDQGNVLDFILDSWTESITVTCRVTNDTSLIGTATKQLMVLVGPTAISISGPDSMTELVTYIYNCSANCRPSCTYTWETSYGYSDQGSLISVTPLGLEFSSVLTCTATNTLSGLFASASRQITTWSSGQTVLSDLNEVTSAVLLSIISATFIL